MLFYFANKTYFRHFFIVICFLSYSYLDGMAQFEAFLSNEKNEIESELPTRYGHVKKVVLDNGLIVLVCESHEIPKVSFQIWYNVGSKDEMIGEKGIAHLIEHMVFKGTNTLSESDIKSVVHKLSGYCNASTYPDYTGYYFNFPTQHWKEAFSIVADCMTNCLFKDDALNAELKVVIQELKLRKDNYLLSLLEGLQSLIFEDHPYHYPIIGYKQDLWNVAGKDLLAFYKKHYHPNNAVLVVVGDVNAAEVIALAEKYFESIPADENYIKRATFFNRDIAAKSLTLYRDIAHPTFAYEFVVPGASEKKEAAIDIFQWILGRGKSSRLYKKLVNEKQLATNVYTASWVLSEHGLFQIIIEPKKIENAAEIERIIIQELRDIAENSLNDEEFERGFKNTQMALYNLFESIEEQGRIIGHAYLATGDENYIFTCLDQPELLRKQIQEIVSTYMRPSIMHKGCILPLDGSEKKHWQGLQAASDKEDEEILRAHIRTSEVEEAVYAKKVEIKTPLPFSFPKATSYTLSNGLKILYYDNNTMPKINIQLRFKARAHYDPEDKQGLYKFVTKMMTEGTLNYTGQELADTLASRGMSLNVYQGGISMEMLSADFTFGLTLLKEILTNATFPEAEIEKVRDGLQAYIKKYWDNPWWLMGQLINEEIYKNHPYSKRIMGTEESIASISREDLINFYQKYISPYEARIAIVGDLPDEDIEQIVKQELGDWPLREIENIFYPPLKLIDAKEISYPINRDQVVLSFVQLSIARTDPKFDAYLLFDQIFGRGQGSRLYNVRVRTGLFYSIWGSLLTDVSEQPGIFEISTRVSLDKLEEAKKAIKNAIDTVADTLTQEELEEAKRAVINKLVDNFATNSDIANTFLYLDRFKLPADYYDNRAADLDKMTLNDMKNAVKDILNSENMITIQVGRV